MESIVNRLDRPRNQHSLAVMLLIENHSKGVTMLQAIQDGFYKFNTRLGEVEREHPKLKIIRLRMTTKNRFGHPCSFLNYKSVAPYQYLIHLYQKLNKGK